MNFSIPSKNLLNKTRILINFKSLKYLKSAIPGMTTGKIISKGIDAINDNQLTYCIKKRVFGVDK